MIPDKTAPQTTARAARQLLRAHRYGALSTLSKKFNGHPFGSITPYLVDHDGSLLILISALAEHTKNILHDPRVSLITHNQEDPHIQTQGRITIVGTAALDAEREAAGKRYLRYFPEAQTYYDMADFQFFRIVPQALRYIGGFGDIHWIKAENYRTPANSLAAEEDALLGKINATRSAAQGLLIGIDCDGFDLRIDERTVRQDFPITVLDANQASGLLQP
ncbi:HugZ family pyridoxamine 5'-phosphate oxidase [Sideroxydans lithotrophicus]|uniref:Pyridoxamine 5'-phosphate oxidase-related FMN-binding protein n=1 Tax=Sideroxydans lithotrophicus (strain ES-1) TaxID=580332 RepID=D5CNR7_SIDLE|nr:pyridoxamine 5'-phosphate oxidase family protein [Sideroxydans lithotrophicus]ADE10980.1 pyridoxamine 5'-phosphate oxidase-related FMN-binding protein [Sideroxydans lithotrophicus ES-1]